MVSLTAATGNAESRNELGLYGGPFLISQATENMAVIGGRFSLAINSNHIKHIELRAFTTSTDLVTYHMGEISLRNQFTIQKMSAVWLAGFDWHYFKGVTQQEFTARQGWHVGCGLNVAINENIMFRNDFIVRFAGYMALSVNIGFAWAFGEN